MDWLGEQLGYTTMDNWYQIEQKDFSNNYGYGLLNGKYNNSPYQLLSFVYPETMAFLEIWSCTVRFMEK